MLHTYVIVARESGLPVGFRAESEFSQFRMHKLGGPLIALGPKLPLISYIGSDDHDCKPVL